MFLVKITSGNHKECDKNVLYNITSGNHKQDYSFAKTI